jgi:excisionase family DNA binding protein
MCNYVQMSANEAKGPDNPAWCGDEASVNTKHAWIREHWPKTGRCEECGREVGTNGQGGTHWSNIDHNYRGVREEWRELCPSCHSRADRARFPRQARPKDLNADLLTVNEAAEVLRVHHSTIRRLIREQRLEHLRVRGTIRIPQDALDALRRPASTKEGVAA